jgi:intracellular multiplication protein IcmD
MYKKITAYLILIFYLLTAQASQSLGDVSQAALEPLTGLKKIIMAVSLITGIAFLMGAIIQYRDHRKNPIQVPLSKPIVYLILSIVFIAMPYWTQLSESAKVFLK